MEDAQTIAETEHFMVWTSEDDGELTFHVALGVVSLHMTAEEWSELVMLIKDADTS